MKLRHISAAVALTILLPFAASAVTTEELQAQIARLLAQVTTLQEQLKSLKTNPSEPTRPIDRTCPQILRQLSQGTSGEDVRGLQAYLGVSQTGYFGPLTASAVSKFQATEGISQVGMVGPQTRAAFARRCGGTKPISNFSASPTSGAAPLAVNFIVRNISYTQGTYVNFGDGTERQQPMGGCGGGEPTSYDSCPLSIQHTYTTPGTYAAKLEQDLPPLPCIGCVGTTSVIGTVTISVGGSTSTGGPTITLLSPNGGETWQGVLGQTIRWSSSNVSNGIVNIYLIDYDYNPQTEDNRTHYLLVKYAANTGSYTIDSLAFPTQVKAGNNYRISIGAYQQTNAGLLDYDNLVQGDLSDAPFTIKN